MHSVQFTDTRRYEIFAHKEMFEIVLIDFIERCLLLLLLLFQRNVDDLSARLFTLIENERKNKSSTLCTV